MARTKTTSNPPPNVDYRALYPRASAGWALATWRGKSFSPSFSNPIRASKGSSLGCAAPPTTPPFWTGSPFTGWGNWSLRSPKTLEERAPPDREVCHVLASLGAVFNTAQLIKHEFSPSSLKSYIGSSLLPSSLHCVCMLSFYYACVFCFFILLHLLTSCTLMTILLSSHVFLSWCRHGT